VCTCLTHQIFVVILVILSYLVITDAFIDVDALTYCVMPFFLQYDLNLTSNSWHLITKTEKELNQLLKFGLCNLPCEW
jgi:hypothetical protein